MCGWLAWVVGVGVQAFSPEEISAMILTKMKQTAEVRATRVILACLLELRD